MTNSDPSRGVASLGKRAIRRVARQAAAPLRRRKLSEAVDTFYEGMVRIDSGFYERRLADTCDYYQSIGAEPSTDFLRSAFEGMPNDYVDYHKYRLTELFCLVEAMVSDRFGADPFTLVRGVHMWRFLRSTLHRTVWRPVELRQHELSGGRGRNRREQPFSIREVVS